MQRKDSSQVERLPSLQTGLQRGCQSTSTFKNSERNHPSLEPAQNRSYIKTSDFVVEPPKNLVQDKLSASNPKSLTKQKRQRIQTSACEPSLHYW